MSKVRLLIGCLMLLAFGAITTGCYVEDRTPDTVIREAPDPPDVTIIQEGDGGY